MVEEILQLAEHNIPLANPTIQNDMGRTARAEAEHRTTWFKGAYETLKAFDHFHVDT